VTLALDADASWKQRLRHIEPGFLRNTALASKEARLFELITASREELAELMVGPKGDPARIAWDHTAFEQRPLLRAHVWDTNGPKPALERGFRAALPSQGDRIEHATARPPAGTKWLS
jgi:hypothetical protein